MRIGKQISDFVQVTVGCALMTVSTNVFLLPYKVSTGGVLTLGTVLLHLFGIKMSLTNLLCNIVLFIFGCKILGKRGIVKTVWGVVLLSVCLELTSNLPVYSENELIAVLSGGILYGGGVGICVKIGASTGGSDFAGLILKRVFSHIPISRLILIINGFIVLIAGVVFKSYTTTIYSFMAIFVSSAVIDRIVTFGDDAKMLQIFSSNTQRIADCILDKYKRGVTGVHCRGMYSHKENFMLLCVLTPGELPAYMNMIKENDPSAFVVVCDVHEVIGKGFKKIY